MTYMDRWSYQIGRTEYIIKETAYNTETRKNNKPSNEIYAHHSGSRISKSIYDKAVHGKQKRKLLFS